MDFQSVHTKFSRQNGWGSSFCFSLFEIYSSSFEQLCSSSGFVILTFNSWKLYNIVMESENSPVKLKVRFCKKSTTNFIGVEIWSEKVASPEGYVGGALGGPIWALTNPTLCSSSLVLLGVLQLEQPWSKAPGGILPWSSWWTVLNLTRRSSQNWGS